MGDSGRSREAVEMQYSGRCFAAQFLRSVETGNFEVFNNLV